ncbi:hypothetical protein GGP41_005729 [Bipolaris sorokiniana]|uniref:Uncharacterized protein n=2 Tax=Cochliobolus sativus TaxID=45130 RepID=A0A8H6DVT6_COCSA|nr:uncharacterized protein COCSADRAFT_26968 [Bipolaris sorokiniana ND90Pr]EMD63628.1 hypothetical protein COCSADRAFT_26968 [Bipolaris sorokiniana ND90Pr]KAF5848325.1 hypothetical protein GGP41_005729 [Bipolaris sorokiniana]
MAGYGNRTAPSYSASDLEPEHNNTRLGLIDSHTPYHNPHDKHGSGTTGGAGFGNKRSSASSTPSTSDMHLGSHLSPTPYSNPAPLGSGSTGGAGYGNKTGEMGGPERDSMLGKVVEKIGGVVGSHKVARVGRGMREKEGFGEEREEVMEAN